MPIIIVIFRKFLLVGTLPLLLLLGACGNEDGKSVEQQAEKAPSELSSNESVVDQADTTVVGAVEIDLEIDKAEWRADHNELWVKVNGNPGDEIRISSDTDVILDTHTLSASEAGSIKIKLTGAPPCTVRVVRTRDGKILEHAVDVKSGQSNCPE